MTKKSTLFYINISSKKVYLEAVGSIAKPLGAQSMHLSVGFTGRENFGNSFIKSAGLISKREDKSKDKNPDTKGAA
jgi:hypothetical protein